jgi:hypothetical protein
MGTVGNESGVLRLAGLFVPLTLRCPCFAAVRPGLLSGRSPACGSPVSQVFAASSIRLT